MRSLATGIDHVARAAGAGSAWGLVLVLLGCGHGGSAPKAPAPLGPQDLTPNTIDFTVDAQTLADTVQFIDRDFPPNDCAVQEGAIGASGVRRLVRFDTKIVNMGSQNCTIGDPANPQLPFTSDDFELGACHGHYHFKDYASYELRRLDGTLAAIGHKQGFCLLDYVHVVTSTPTRGYNCAYQGISSGWGDVYARGLDGQWVDVTGLPEADYLLVVTVNPNGTVFEADDRRPDTATVLVHVPDPTLPPGGVDDHGDDMASATGILFPSTSTGTINSPQEPDWFSMPVVSGQTYTVHVELLGLQDSVLYVFEADGATEIGHNDDVAFPGDLSSTVVFTAAADGTVGIRVTGFSDETGGYRLHVQ